MRSLAVALAVLLACGGADAKRVYKGSRTAAAPTATLTVTWGAIPTTDADNTAIGTITDQQVCYDTTSRMGTPADYGTCVSVGSASALTYQLTGLAANTTYYIATKVVVSGTVSGASVEVSATTDP
jgi:hypothetical protein